MQIELNELHGTESKASSINAFKLGWRPPPLSLKQHLLSSARQPKKSVRLQQAKSKKQQCLQQTPQCYRLC